MQYDLSIKKKLVKNWNELITGHDSSASFIGGMFILLTGLPGSGKSTLSRRLSHKLDCINFDFSNFTKQLIGNHPQKQSSYSYIGSLIEPHIYSALNDGMTIIYDTTSLNEEMRQHHFSKIPSKCSKIIVWLDTPREICRQRLLQRDERDRPILDRGVHRSSLDSVRTFEDFCEEFEPPEKSIRIFPDQDINFITLDLLSELSCND